VLFFEHLLLPFAAVIALGVVDHRTRQGTIAEWLVNIGWDSCVLAAGAAPGIFAGARAIAWCGRNERYAQFGSVFFLLITVALAGLFVSPIKAKTSKTELHALGALFVGGALLCFLGYLGWDF
jgi:hypothetical protein